MDALPPGVEDLPPELRAGIAARPTPLRRALGVLLRLAGVALLAVVLLRVPWQDRLHLADGRVLAGRILAVEGGTVRFEVAGTERPGERRFAASALAVRDRGLPAAEEGVFTLAGRLTAGPALLVFLITGVSVVAAAFRWGLLLRTLGVGKTLGDATALTFLGNFFNQVVPGGIVGGDVLKAVYAARGTGRGAACAVGVFTDRVVGLFGTVVLACVALIPRFADPRFHGHALLAYGILAAGLAGAALVLSRRVRRLLGVERWMPRIPLVGAFLAEADRAVLAYRERKGAVAGALLVSVGIHAGWCVANALLGSMLGLDLALGDWFAVIPPILVVSAIPLLPGGWGIGEFSFVLFLGLLGVPAAPALAVSILGRSLQMLWALPGGFVFLARRA